MVQTNLKTFCLTLMISTPVFSLPLVILRNVFTFWMSLDSTGNITTDLYVKPTNMHQYLLATSCHPNHTKRSIPYSQALRILRICSNIETARSRCTELVDCLVKCDYKERKTNIPIECTFSNVANPIRPAYFNVQLHMPSAFRSRTVIRC